MPTPARRSFAVLLALFFLLSATACSDDPSVHPEVDFKPALLPVKFTIGPNGVDVSGESTIVTPVGLFSINAKYSLPDRPQNAIYVVIRDRTRNRGVDDIYLVNYGGGALRAVVDGRTEIQVEDGRVTIDVTSGRIRTIQLSRTPAAASAAGPNAVESWWHNGARKWDAGWDRSLYKPFALTRLAYDDSTLNKWYGLGFLWFLARLAVTLLVIPLDVVLSVVFLLAQGSYYFWGPTGQNIIYGVGLLAVLALGAMAWVSIRA
ncbi:hypothetical protein [Symbioplanes lichenis]|uniref:hypothetical protein n=1 Tax=Symbioplanes lichenis TaxID=1629072 RepID=UPI00273A1F31|nr:hypothetical protein [Actinoplanes lichenis]